MATFGKIGEFDAGSEEWSQYVERIGHFFEANGVTEERKKRAVLLLVVGPTTYKLLRNLIAPVKPGEKDYDDIIEVLKKYFDPPPSEIVQRYRFHTHSQKEQELVATFVAELRALAEHCKFGDTLDLMLRDRLVCGVKDGRTQRRLLSESKLTFQRALEIAQAQETELKGMEELKEPSAQTDTQEELHQLSSKDKTKASDERPKTKDLACYRCGKIGHLANSCRHRMTQCHLCGKMGHLGAVCRSKPQPPEKKAGQTSLSVKRLEDREEPDDYNLFQLQGSQMCNPFEVTISVQDQPLTMEVDTGASLSIMSEETFRKHWPRVVLQESNVKLKT